MRVARILMLPAMAVFLLWPPAAAGEGTADSARWFLDAVQHYRQGDYESAARLFSRVADQGVRNPKLYYNLGNAYLKMDAVGPAICWYERALTLSPNDPDLKFNLEQARSRVTDEAEQQPSVVGRVLFFWNYRLSREAVQWTAVGANLLLWCILGLGAFFRRPALKAIGIPLAFLSVLFAATGVYNYLSAARFRAAIVLTPEAPVRSGVMADATELFVLHAGTRVRIDRELDQHYRIRFSEEKIGWVDKDKLCPL